MIWHIRMGKLSWCKAPYSQRRDLLVLARTEGIVLTCSHLSKEKSQKMVDFLHRSGIDFARVVEGKCSHQHEQLTKKPTPARRSECGQS